MRTGWIGLLAGAALLAAAPGAMARDSSSIRVSLRAAGGSGGDIEGTASFRSRDHVALFVVRIRNAEPGTLLTLEVGGEEIASVETDDRGNARFLFQEKGLMQGNGLPGRARSFDFEPRGKELVVSGPNGTLLSAFFGPDDSTDTRIREVASFRPPPGERDARGEIRFTQADGVQNLVVDVEGVEDSDLVLFVDGTECGPIVAARGRGSATFSNVGDPALAPLDFEPFGERVEVRRGSDVVLSGRAMSDAGLETITGDGGTGGGGTPGP
jgi:hypothetical protein